MCRCDFDLLLMCRLYFRIKIEHFWVITNWLLVSAFSPHFYSCAALLLNGLMRDHFEPMSAFTSPGFIHMQPHVVDTGRVLFADATNYSLIHKRKNDVGIILRSRSSLQSVRKEGIQIPGSECHQFSLLQASRMFLDSENFFLTHVPGLNWWSPKHSSRWTAADLAHSPRNYGHTEKFPVSHWGYDTDWWKWQRCNLIILAKFLSK